MFQVFLVFLLISLSFSDAQTPSSCRPTTRDVEGPFFEAGAPNVKILAPAGELTSGKKIMVEGYVMSRSCKPISGALVHAWYAGGDPVGYTFPNDYLWYRGFVRTDKNGKYSYVATYPGTYSGRPIPHIHYKVITPTKTLTTQLYFKNDIPPSYEDYVNGRQSQFPSSMTRTSDGRNVRFDLVMDTP